MSDNGEDMIGDDGYGTWDAERLDEEYRKLKAENKRLKKIILLAPGTDEQEFLKKYRKWWDTFYREIRSPNCNLMSIEQALKR